MLARLSRILLLKNDDFLNLIIDCCLIINVEQPLKVCLSFQFINNLISKLIGSMNVSNILKPCRVKFHKWTLLSSIVLSIEVKAERLVVPGALV